MSKNDTLGVGSLLPEVTTFASLLAQEGVVVALAYLNCRTPHRYMGLFRFEGEELCTQVLFDCHHFARQPEQEAQLATAYCTLVRREQAGLTSANTPVGQLMVELVNPPLFYHSVLIGDAQRRAYGTLCHYDLQRCQPRTTDQPLLEAAATLLYAHCSTLDTDEVSPYVLTSSGTGLS